jgi:cell division protein FtsW (lipid II flippase)
MSLTFRGPASVRRNTELGLLLMVVVITAGAYTLLSLGQQGDIPKEIWGFLVVVLGVFVAAHIVTRRVAPRANSTLLPLAGLLNGLGFVLIARVKADLAWSQALWSAVGIGVYCGTLIFVRRARSLDRYRWTFALFGMVLLVLPLMPKIGEDFGSGSRIWVRIPGVFSFQPGEGAKILLAVFFASYLVEKRELLAFGSRKIGPVNVPELRHFGPVLMACGVALLVLVYQKDLGSSLLFFTLFLVMLWVATERGSYLAVGVTLFSIGAVICWKAIPVVGRRVDTWLNPFADARGDSYQILQFTYLMSDGGVAGTGLGMSGSLNFMPQAESDFIFAVAAAELGMPGALAIITAFILLVAAGLHIAQEAENAFDKLLACGLTTLLGIQAFVIMAGVTRLLPLTGVTLPFVSQGGTSLVANYVLLALLVRISDETSNEPVATTGMVPV